MAVILIIDDEKLFREMLVQMMERAGYEVVEASDGREGLKFINERQIDLVITDIIMPEKEGTETIIEIRRNFPEVKIIAISGGGRNTPEQYLETAGMLGAQYTFTKPIVREEVLSAVEECLK